MTNPMIPIYIHIPVLGGNLHNGYLQTLAELGIIGFMILIWANYNFIRYLISGYHTFTDPETKSLAALGLSLIIALFARAAFESAIPYGFINTDILLLVSFCIIVKMLELKRTD